MYDEAGWEWLYPVSLNPKAQVYFTTGTEHKVRIECIGNTIRTWLDGLAVADVVDTITTNEGMIGLQLHSIDRPELTGIKCY